MANDLKFKISKKDIVSKLTNLRIGLASKLGIEAYKVLQNATIFEIAEKMPQNDEELLQIKGIGEKKLAQFGDLILKEIHGEVQEKKEINFEDEIFTVSNFLDYINNILLEESDSFRVQGEISGINIHTSGTYFALKDIKDESVMNCWVPPHFYQMMGLELEDGMEIKVEGYPNIHKPKGRFSMVVQSFELAGEGSLKKAYEQLKKKLHTEGLFERKRELKPNITKIGLITSRSGAAIDDFRKNLLKRGFEINFYDVRVEGIKAVPEIIKAIKYLNDIGQGIDALVITRGGGSLEDLQAFNNEQVAREIFASSIPTICAIGHERDIPIASLVGDVSVSTPTAAAIRINDSWQAMEEYTDDIQQKLIAAQNEAIYRYKNELNIKVHRLINDLDKLFNRFRNLERFFHQKMKDIGEKLNLYQQELIGQKENLLRSFESVILRMQDKLKHQISLLRSNDPQRNLRLGYSIAYLSSGKVIKSVKKLKKDDLIKVDFHDGDIESSVKKINKK